MDVIDNVVPYIGGEEEKIEWETSKILGGIADDKQSFTYHQESPLKISASCNRVAVIDGHTECVSVSFVRRPAPSPQQVIDAMRSYTSLAQTLGKEKVPSAPEHSIVVLEEQDRPQPRLDRNLEDGATVVVGRVRECPVFDIKFVCLSDKSVHPTLPYPFTAPRPSTTSASQRFHTLFDSVLTAVLIWLLFLTVFA